MEFICYTMLIEAMLLMLNHLCKNCGDMEYRTQKSISV